MPILETLAPVILLIAFGAVLAHIRFLGSAFMADLNKLAFWIALPCLIFRSIAEAQTPDPDTGKVIVVLVVASLIGAAVGWLATRWVSAPSETAGTLAQGAFRGNLAYVGLPVLFYSFANLDPAHREAARATSLLAMASLTAIYNVMAVCVLQGSRHQLDRKSLALMARSIATNPLIIACLAGIAASMVRLRLPVIIDRPLEALGAIAVPVALLCIGGALAGAQLQGRRAAVFVGALAKVALIPLFVWLGCHLAGISGVDQRIALVFSACPTAAASFVMAREMGGDAVMASGIIAVSTVLSAPALALVLFLAS